MVWFLVGLVLNGIIIGFVTTALTSIGQPEDISLYDTKASVSRLICWQYTNFDHETHFKNQRKEIKPPKHLNLF